MPYITQERRKEFPYPETTMEHPGELNYQICLLLNKYIKDRGGLNYQGICEVSGVLSNVSDEFYRRVAAPYEDKKIYENGDVF